MTESGQSNFQCLEKRGEMMVGSEMGRRSLEPLGLLLDRLNLSVATLARHLHVDASLVSKWKTGQRRLTDRSGHLAAVVEFFCALAADETTSQGRRIVETLREFNPLAEGSRADELCSQIRDFLTGELQLPIGSELVAGKASSVAQISLYDGPEGRRNAVDDLLKLAEEMETPGRMTFIECEQYRWFLEDRDYTQRWQSRMLALLNRGFQVTFVAHMTASHDQPFHRFFRDCTALLFHRNAHWHHHVYYDDEVHWFSFFILEHALSVMGLSMGPQQCDTTVFADARSIGQHKRVVDAVGQCSRPFFVDFEQGRLMPSVSSLLDSNWQEGKLYAYLPVPVFAAAPSDLIEDILHSNGVKKSVISHCLKENSLVEELFRRQGDGLGIAASPIVVIYQIEEMRRRIADGGFTSCSLSLMAGQPIRVNRQQYARGMELILERLERNEGTHVALASREDLNDLPSLNCWCKEGQWLIQMDEQGVRVCSEGVMVRAAVTTLERCLRKIPPERKQKKSLQDLLCQMIRELK